MNRENDHQLKFLRSADVSFALAVTGQDYDRMVDEISAMGFEREKVSLKIVY